MTAILTLPLALSLLASAPPAAGCRIPAAEPLGAHCAALAARPRLPLPGPGDREALRQVLSRPELRRARTDTAGLRRLLAGLWERILERLGSAEAERYASVGRLVFILAGLAAALAALAAVRRRRAPARAHPAGGEPGRAAPPPPGPGAALADAEAALLRGDLSGVVRHAFLSSLAALEEAGAVPRDRTLTNRELAHQLARAGGASADDFGELGRTFDGAVYGGARIILTEARECLARARRIRATAEGGR